jgi:hypothetical protein
MTEAARAALLPHPPLLVPQLAGAAATELDPLRTACRKAVDAVLSASGALVVIGDGPVWGVAARAAVGSFAPYGADVEVQLPSARLWVDIAALPEPRRLEVLPLSLAVAAWLLDSAAPGGRGARLTLVRDEAPPAEEPHSGASAASAARLSAVPPASGGDEPPGRGGRSLADEVASGGAPGAGRLSAVPPAGDPGEPPGPERRSSAPTGPAAGRTGALAEVPPVGGAPARDGRPRAVAEAPKAGGDGPVTARRVPPLFACTVPATLGPGAAAAIGRALVEAAADRGPVGLIAMADLSARRTEAAPGAFHPEAAAFDARIADAFRSGDLTPLAELDLALAAELEVGGRTVLQAMAGAVQGGAPLAGRVLYDDAPYGVGYLVGVVERQAGEVPERSGDPA